MTAVRIRRLIGREELRDVREEDVRRFVFAMTRLGYEQGRLDALNAIHRMVD